MGYILYVFKRFFFQFYPQDIENIEDNWKCGKHNLQRINCRSENSKGVYCLQYDDQKIVSGLRDNTIKIWERSTLSCLNVLNGHTGSVLCLQVLVRRDDLHSFSLKRVSQNLLDLTLIFTGIRTSVGHFFTVSRNLLRL